jgi:hypothetical protein
MAQQKLYLLEIHPLDRPGVFPEASAGKCPCPSFLFGRIFPPGSAQELPVEAENFFL